MDRPSSESSTLPWFWIIEYLTSFQLVPTGILHGLIKEAPPFPDDLKGKVDELVALRCLEELCSVGYEPSASTVALGEKVGIDLSNTCQDVLACILQEASVSDIMTKAKPLRWDIKPFILHKRAAMPKTYLQQLKDANFEGQQGRDKSEFLLPNKKRKMTYNLDSENLANNLHEGQQFWDDFDHFTDSQFKQFLHDAIESAAVNESGRRDDVEEVVSAAISSETREQHSWWWRYRKDRILRCLPLHRTRSAPLPHRQAGCLQWFSSENELSERRKSIIDPTKLPRPESPALAIGKFGESDAIKSAEIQKRNGLNWQAGTSRISERESHNWQIVNLSNITGLNSRLRDFKSAKSSTTAVNHHLISRAIGG